MNIYKFSAGVLTVFGIFALYNIATRPEPQYTFGNASAQPVNTLRVPQSHVGPAVIYPIVIGMRNPDISQVNIGETICNPSWSTKSIRPSTSYTGPIKVRALDQYNRYFGTNYSLKDGELDHLISLELGGSPTSENNLWFEPYITHVDKAQIGAHEKDKVENWLHSEVCNGSMTLQYAQDLVVNSWYEVYLSKVSPVGAVGGINDFNSVSNTDPDDN